MTAHKDTSNDKKDKWVVEDLKGFKGAEKLSPTQLQKLVDVLNLAPEVVDKLKVEELISIV